MPAQKLFIIVNVDWFFLSHRLSAAVAAKKEGYEVTIVCADTGKLDDIRNHGFCAIKLPLSRGLSSFLSEIRSFFFLFKLYRNIPDAIIHQVGLKLILFGSIAHRLSFSKSKLVNALSGAGTLFTSVKRPSFALRLLLLFFSFLSKKKTTYIFQNYDDASLFEDILGGYVDYFVVKGSGVDLKTFSYSQVSLKRPYMFLFIGRLLREKGIFEFLEAAKIILSSKYKNECQFVVLGTFDEDNPSGVKENELSAYKSIVDFVGFSDNVAKWIKESYCVVLPSYREGFPKALIEACAIGRPIITTNTVGCREAVREGQNGYLVPLYNSSAIVKGIISLINKPEIVLNMGEYSRFLAETEFDEIIINRQILDVYKHALMKDN